MMLQKYDIAATMTSQLTKPTPDHYLTRLMTYYHPCHVHITTGYRMEIHVVLPLVEEGGMSLIQRLRVNDYFTLILLTKHPHPVRNT